MRYFTFFFCCCFSPKTQNSVYLGLTATFPFSPGMFQMLNIDMWLKATISDSVYLDNLQESLQIKY